MTILETSVQELATLKELDADFVLLDVRETWEHELSNLDGLLIPLGELPLRLSELNPNMKIIVHCLSGGRSARATAYLQDKGFSNVSNLRGGLKAWVMEINPEQPLY
jgi:rhodanese-related sulfurtransferase